MHIQKGLLKSLLFVFLSTKLIPDMIYRMDSHIPIMYVLLFDITTYLKQHVFFFYIDVA